MNDKENLPYKIGIEVKGNSSFLKEKMENSEQPCFYVILIPLYRITLIKIGKTRNASQRFKSYYRAYNGNFTILKLFFFRRSNKNKYFEYDYKQAIHLSDIFESKIIQKIKDLAYYKNKNVQSVEYYRQKHLKSINNAIEELIKDIKYEYKENKIRKSERNIKNNIRKSKRVINLPSRFRD